jgi:hypothetical protein
MGKKASGKTYTSKGERRSSIGSKQKDPGQRLLNQLDALAKGRDVVVSLPNVDKNGKVHPNTKTKIDGKAWVKRRQNFSGVREVAE